MFDYGLRQANEMLEQLHDVSSAGVNLPPKIRGLKYTTVNYNNNIYQTTTSVLSWRALAIDIPVTVQGSSFIEYGIQKGWIYSCLIDSVNV
jgi:hypothetical protein